MSKRLITVIFASLAVLGLASAPAQAASVQADQRTNVRVVQTMGWDWGI
jgi:hypothetical protein